MTLPSPTLVQPHAGAWRAKAASIHLILSIAVAAVVALLMFSLWYPGDYRTLAGGNKLFWLIVSVDVVMGPLLTFVVFNPAKPRKELWRDLAVIALLQLGALGYGLHVLFESRPVALVFEVDRFRVVSASDVLMDELPKAPADYRKLPITGPWVLGARMATGKEKIEAVELALQGFDVGTRPSFWQPYADTRGRALERARPVGALLEKYPAARADIEARLKALGLPSDTARFLPVSARVMGWVTLMRPDGEIAGFAPYDGFF